MAMAVIATLMVHVAAEAAAKKKTKTPATKAAAKTAPAAGKVCTPAGAQAAGTNLDCVAVGKALQWQPRGTRVNPYRLNDVADYTAYQGDKYRLKITGSAPRPPAEIGAPADGRPPIPTGSAPLQIGAELTYLGANPAGDPPARLTTIEVVDAANAKYGLYGDKECTQYGSTLATTIGLRSLVKDTPATEGFCVIVPTASVGPNLLIHFYWIDDQNGIWFKTSA